jgi:hypothetical protein
VGKKVICIGEIGFSIGELLIEKYGYLMSGNKDGKLEGES